MLTSIEKAELVKKKWTPEEITQLEVQLDPVLWAETFLRNPDDPSKPLKLRWYQKKMLRCSSRKKVYRCGRRIGKSVVLCVEMLWKAFTNNDRQILVCAPYKKHIIEMWKDGFFKLLKDNEYLSSSIVRIGQNPHTVELKNGSRIVGLTAGTSTGNKGASIRGSNAHDLYLDEADYIGEEAIHSIMAIIATKKDTTFVVSSTPTGKREFFYKISTNPKLGFEAFHYPSSVSPEWLSIEEAKKKDIPLHESQEFLFRNSNPEHVYSHEYMAEFGEEAQGVFKHKFIDRAIVRYNPNKELIEPNGLKWWCGDEQHPKNIYIMGVDWNGDKVGTQIILTELCRDSTEIEIEDPENDGKFIKVNIFGKYRPFYRESISIHEMTQTASIQKIIELNSKYKIDYIYVDAGFGTTNIEELKLYGMRFRESGFLNKIRSIDFHGNLTIWDPFLKQQVQKPIKPFMVNNAMTIVERNEIVLPESEDEKIKLVGQMREYVIEKISTYGQPTYSKGNDHILDAFMLSLLGFHMEYSELIHVEYGTNVLMTKTPLVPQETLAKIPSRWEDKTNQKLKSLGVQHRAPRLGADHFIPDTRGYTKDYSDLVKENKDKSPIAKVTTPLKSAPNMFTNWSRRGAPVRSNF